MSDWSPASVEVAIFEAAQRIAKGVTLSSNAYRAYQQANHALDIAYAKAYLTIDGPAHAKRYEAELATIDERAAKEVAESVYKLMDRNAKAIESELDALRSIGTSVRQAYQTAGVGER